MTAVTQYYKAIEIGKKFTKLNSTNRVKNNTPSKYEQQDKSKAQEA